MHCQHMMCASAISNSRVVNNRNSFGVTAGSAQPAATALQKSYAESPFAVAHCTANFNMEPNKICCKLHRSHA